MGLDLGRLKFNDTRNIFSRSSVGSLSSEVIDRFAVKLSCGDCLDVVPEPNTDADVFTFLVVSFRGLPLGRDGFGALGLMFTIYHGECGRSNIDAHLVFAICIINLLLALSLARHFNQGEHPDCFLVVRCSRQLCSGEINSIS